MKSIFSYIALLLSKIIELFKDIKMSKSKLEQDFEVLKRAFIVKNEVLVFDILFSRNNSGYDFNFKYHNTNQAKFFIEYNPIKNENNIIYEYYIDPTNPLIKELRHDDYINVLVLFKDEIEPLYNSYMKVQHGSFYMK